MEDAVSVLKLMWMYNLWLCIVTCKDYTFQCAQIRGFEKRGKDDYTVLVPKLTGLDPDEVYSCIPYEKGSSFLFYLESLIGGPGEMIV